MAMASSSPPPPLPSVADADAAGVLHALAEAVEDGMFVVDPGRTRFRFVSPRVLSIWGVTPQDLARSPACFVERVLPADRWIYQQREAAERRGEAVDVSFRIRHQQLGLRWLRVRTRARALQGELCVYGLITDVTGERERELELQRARDEAEAASQARSDFVAAVSHEMRTPMNGILGMTELLLATELGERQRRYAQAVYRCGESLLEIVNDVLDFSQAQAGRLEIAGGDFDLPALVDDTLALLAPKARDKRVGLRLAPGLDLLPARRVHGDALRLGQVLAHLVDNAIKFTDAGEVVVALQAVPALPGDSLLPPAPGAWLLRLTVTDTGIGIEPAQLPRLFDAFSQGQRGSARRYGGLGLGLAVSQRLVQLMGGALEAQSRPGEGSCFAVTLPLGPAGTAGVAEEDAGPEPAVGADDPPSDPASEPAGLARGLRGLPIVLVVEDNVVNQEVVAQMLRALGCRVRVACSAADGLKALCETRFDLVLMDIHMPGMDGAAALQRFRNGPSRRHPFVTPAATPVIAVTANALEGDAERFLALGFDDYLSKPFRQSQLHTMLKRRLSPAAPATGTDAGGAPAAAGDRWSGLLQVLDAQALERLRELDPKGVNGLIARVLKAFEGSLQRLMAQLQDARRQGDHAGMRHVAHTLKSSSASVGALELSRLCADIERRIRQDDTQDLDSLLDGMIAESGRVLAVLTPALEA